MIPRYGESAQRQADRYWIVAENGIRHPCSGDYEMAMALCSVNTAYSSSKCHTGEWVRKLRYGTRIF